MNPDLSVSTTRFGSHRVLHTAVLLALVVLTGLTGIDAVAAEAADPYDPKVAHAGLSPDIVVWYSPQVMRGHRPECRRYLRMSEKRKAQGELITLAELEKRGKLLCSRCPGSHTPGKGNDPNLPKSWVNPPRDEVRTAEYETPALAPLVSIGADGKLAYKPYSDKGDRIIDYSTSGYKRSEEPIPVIPVVETLKPLTGETKVEGNMQYPVGPDSFEAIQAALDKVASMAPGDDGFRGAVLLKKGIWHVSRGLLVPSGVVLRGEGDGEDGTVLIFTMPDGNGTGIQVGGGEGTSTKTPTPVTGILRQDQDNPDEQSFILTMDDGTQLPLSEPKFKHDFKLVDFVGNRVTVTLPLITTTQGNVSSYRLKHNMPYTIEKVADGQAVPQLDPNFPHPAKAVEKPVMPESRIADAYVPTGATQLTLEDASAFRAGDTVNILKTTNEMWIEVLGVGERLRHIRGGKQGAYKKPWRPNSYSHLRRITAVNSNTITLDGMLPQSIAAEHGGGTVRKVIPTEDTLCGVESIRIVSNYDKTQKSGSKSANYGNLKNGVGVSAMDGWVRDCTVLHVWFAAVNISGARYITARDCQSLQPVGAKRGGKRYSFSISGGNNILIYRCFAEDGRHDYVLGARSAGPFAFVECTAVRGGQSEPHHRWSTGPLYDNVITKDGTLAAINRGDSGSGHGWAAANAMFWNCDAKSIVVMDPETAGENNFAIGYRGTYDPETGPKALRYANDRAGYWGTPQEGKYYGHALMGSGHIESPDKPVEPESLFKQQLIDRIGKEKAAEVLK